MSRDTNDPAKVAFVEIINLIYNHTVIGGNPRPKGHNISTLLEKIYMIADEAYEKLDR